MKHRERRETLGDDAVRAVTLALPHAGEVAVVGAKAPSCTAAVAATAHGDGLCPAHAEIEEGRIVELVVRFG